jgi:threonine aldolase
MFGAADDLAALRAARERGVLLSRTDPGRLRAVTHLDVSAADIDEALDRFAALAPGQAPNGELDS